MENLTPWERYKQNLGSTRPWDFLNPNTEYVDSDVQEKRYSICNLCPEFISLTKQCGKCGCLMPAKTKLKQASCPLHKW
jgi:hypothetical protein